MSAGHLTAITQSQGFYQLEFYCSDSKIHVTSTVSLISALDIKKTFLLGLPSAIKINLRSVREIILL